MFLLDLFADLTRPFRNPLPQIEDSDDEADEFMSLTDNNSEADILGVNDDDISMSRPPCRVVGAESFSNADLNCMSTPPTSPLHKRPVSDDRSTPYSKRCSAIRCARSTAARYSAYKLPSREQRHAFIRSRNSHRKEMFVDGLHDDFIPPAGPSIVHPIADLALSSVHVDMAAPHVEEHDSEHLITIPYNTQSRSDLTIKIPNAVDQLGLQLQNSCIVSEQTEEDEEDRDVVDYATKNSGLTIKIPGLVDRLALRLLGSCNMNEQTEEDNLSLDGSIASESSSSDSDGIDDDDDDTSSSYSSSPVSTAAGPDRTSRRKHRRIAAPYHRAEGKPKRKELWADTAGKRGAHLPARVS